MIEYRCPNRSYCSFNYIKNLRCTVNFNLASLSFEHDTSTASVNDNASSVVTKAAGQRPQLLANLLP